MKVLCINAINTAGMLHEGRVYEVIPDSDLVSSYRILDPQPNGENLAWSRQRFEPVNDEVGEKTTTEQLQPWKERKHTSTEGVISIQEFRKKYGAHGLQLRLLVEEYLDRAPYFRGQADLAEELGIAMADLESALKYDPR